MWTVEALARDLAAGNTTSRELVEQALARIAEPAGEGARAFMKVHADAARADADHADRLRKAGIVRSAVDGLPVSVKDLFDVGGRCHAGGFEDARRRAGGEGRCAGRGALARGGRGHRRAAPTWSNSPSAPPASIAHYGTPKNPWDRKTGRVPGGSSSGAAVAQADGMCVMALGSDTRGSIRQPAALCGVAGFKPTQRRVPRDGAFPLSFTLDSIGPLANTVACCAAYDAVLAAQAVRPAGARSRRKGCACSSRSRFADRRSRCGGGEAHSRRASQRLSRAGAVITRAAVPAFERQAEYFRSGGFAGAEALCHPPRPAGPDRRIRPARRQAAAAGERT